jgi:hypothetical protein
MHADENAQSQFGSDNDVIATLLIGSLTTLNRYFSCRTENKVLACVVFRIMERNKKKSLVIDDRNRVTNALVSDLNKCSGITDALTYGCE